MTETIGQGQLYSELNKSWKSTCRIVLGDEVGDLKEYGEWLHEYLPNYGRRTSYISGKDVVLVSNDYWDKARIISMDESNESKAQLNINDIKDIDSIIEAVAENWTYIGNRVLGNSSLIENSEGVIDSHYVSESSDIQNSSHVFASSLIIRAKNVFGILRCGGGEFLIRCMRGKFKRCFETFLATDSSDLYYCSNMGGCSDMLFSFNQRNKRNMIGNLQLSKEKYLEIKRKLLSELRDDLRKNKRLSSLFDLIPNAVSELPTISIPVVSAKTDMGAIERGFLKTSKILLKKELGSILDYEEWLLNHVGKLREIKTLFGPTTHTLDDSYFSIYSKFPEKRAVTAETALELSKLSLSETEISSIRSIHKNLGKIAYLTDEGEYGTNHNMIKTPIAHYSANSYNTHSSADGSEHTGVCSTAVASKYVYGSRITDSQFCINCYNSLNLNRCFEMDSCNNCSDSYFCHNCDGLAEAMFCWNLKAKRYAIGNNEIPADKYKSVKESILQQLVDELIKTKSLKYDIFNIGGGKT